MYDEMQLLGAIGAAVRLQERSGRKHQVCSGSLEKKPGED
jgi:hypothetical protein